MICSLMAYLDRGSQLLFVFTKQYITFSILPPFADSLSYLQTTPTQFSSPFLAKPPFSITFLISISESFSFPFFFCPLLVIFVAMETAVADKEQDDLGGCKRGSCAAWCGGGNSTKGVEELSKKYFSFQI